MRCLPLTTTASFRLASRRIRICAVVSLTIPIPLEEIRLAYTVDTLNPAGWRLCIWRMDARTRISARHQQEQDLVFPDRAAVGSSGGFRSELLRAARRYLD
jgi:hypothetical protein